MGNEENKNNETLSQFPCLKHAHVFGEDDEDDQLYVCVAADGHEGVHDFAPASAVTVKFKDEAVAGAVN